ncbi:MFS transporter [Brevibacillus reuszeri]|uniref:MFS transporter n=1 Tax=Brevibacillus reuszeri TaxID=54915 RepID=UPI002897589E|nr:MFS transporter [Brevibacillus reuszeri]
MAYFYPLLRKPNLRRLLSANLLSGIGDWFNSVAVLSLLLEITGTAMAVGITLALRTLPHLLFGPIGGLVADRFNRKTVLIVCDLARALIALSFLLVAHEADLWIVYTGTFLLVAFSAMYNPSRLSLLPQIVSRDELAAANALDQSVFGIVMAIGSLVGGVFIALWGSEIAFLYNSLSFLASALLLVRLTVSKQQEQQESDSEGESLEKAATYKDVLQFIQKTPIVYAILLLTTLWPIGGGIINVLISVYAYQVFDAGNMGIGLLYGAIGLGFIVGGLIAQRLQRYPYEVASVGLAIEGFAFLLTSFSPTIYVTALFYALSTIAGGMGNACLNTILMRHVTSRYHGRVFALEMTLSNVLIGLSMLTGGWVLTVAEPRIVGFVAGVFVTLSSILIGRFIWKTAKGKQAKNHARGDGRGTETFTN